MPPGTVIVEMVQNVDYATTFLDYAGVKVPKDIQGKFMRSLLRGEHTKWRNALYYTYYEYSSIFIMI
ncbi:MAG TPA: DUF4976 domain-containing protein [Leeuwenhoekiella sp.]|nr:DUF4976 domain-containing protein [Leeuwenhoekiella sp.]